MTLADELALPEHAEIIAAQAAREAALAPLCAQYEALLAQARDVRAAGEPDIAAAETLETQAEAINVQIAAARLPITEADEALAATINAKTANVQTPIPVMNVKRYLMVTGKWTRIGALARGLVTGTPEEVLAAVALADAFESLTEFDLRVPAYAQACNARLDDAITAGLMDSDEKAYILAMADKTVPLWETLLHRPLDHGDIKTARAAL